MANLLSADASITPAIVAGNTSASTMMIFETFARMLPAGRAGKDWDSVFRNQTVIQLLQS